MTMFLFKKPEYRKFNLKPCYWDPVKEEQEARKRRIRAELGLEEKKEGESYASDIRTQFQKEYAKRKATRGSANAGRTLRLFMILIMLFMIAFYVFAKNPDGIMRFFGL